MCGCERTWYTIIDRVCALVNVPAMRKIMDSAWRREADFSDSGMSLVSK